VLSPDDVDLWYFDLEEETSGRIGMCNWTDKSSAIAENFNAQTTFFVRYL
jgi:hypothetical protein